MIEMIKNNSVAFTSAVRHIKSPHFYTSLRYRYMALTINTILQFFQFTNIFIRTSTHSYTERQRRKEELEK